jgi:hypothetical protein
MYKHRSAKLDRSAHGRSEKLEKKGVLSSICKPLAVHPSQPNPIIVSTSRAINKFGHLVKVKSAKRHEIDDTATP